MKNIIYSFTTSNSNLLKNHLHYTKTTLIPSYQSQGYTATLLWSDNISFGLSTNCPYIFNSDKLGNYSYIEKWTQNYLLVGYQEYKSGQLVRSDF